MAQRFFNPFGGSRFELSESLHVDEADAEAKGHLERVRAFLDNGDWEEAVETLRQVAESHGEQLIAVTPRRFLPVSDYCHMQIAALPEQALALYRERVDPQARQWFEEAQASRDSAPLARILKHAYCSSLGDDALLLLGDMALEAGDIGAARGCWEQLLEAPPSTIEAGLFERVRQSPDLSTEDGQRLDRWYAGDSGAEPNEYWLNTTAELDDAEARALVMLWKHWWLPPTRMAYPATEIELASVRARLVLASIMEGSLERAAAEVDAYAARYPDARGAFGGRETVFAAELARLLAAAKGWPAIEGGADWPTFAGAAARNGVATRCREAQLAWRQPLPKPPVTEVSYPSRRVAETKKELLSYHPIIVGDLVVVATQYEIRAYRLATGEPAWGEDPVIYQPSDPVRDKHGSYASSLGAPRFTLTSYDGALLARMGDPLTGRPADMAGYRQPSQIVGLDLKGEGRLLWKPLQLEDHWAFEGAPVCDGGRLYVALRRSEVRPQAHVACYDLQTGEQIWRQFVCGAETPARGQIGECTHNLLTLHGGVLYYNTNLGAVAALSASDGQVRWLTRYARAQHGDLNSRAAHFYRDLTPCLYDRGRLFVAPSDSELVLAIDAPSGMLLWETDLAEDVVHLLGAAGDHLWASGSKLWRIHLDTGKIGKTNGEYGGWPGGESPRGFGRGVLAGGEVLWPTDAMIHVFDQQSGLKTDQIELSQRDARGGNLLAAHDMLLIATSTELIAFGAPATRHVRAADPPADALSAGKPDGGRRLSQYTPPSGLPRRASNGAE